MERHFNMPAGYLHYHSEDETRPPSVTKEVDRQDFHIGQIYDEQPAKTIVCTIHITLSTI